ncbi:unnamed protein product [Bursaphelenchus xylophilus]|uniref:(pine wood nematode) hypothetical protein n=1 Tax=Bursaphelenchus xylophilus TaxID=6326 RepID=A0A7I8WG56_BURXY|nr:unnamed protein product [Bursaphelenchus xylophilus]CAG9111771.1 unnamed protein product [Bursaphelenchus xylophilus]
MYTLLAMLSNFVIGPKFLERLYLPTYLINKLFDLDKTTWSQWKWYRKLTYCAHCVILLGIMSLTCLVIVLEPLYFHKTIDFRQSCNSVALFAIRVQGFVAAIFLLIWNYYGYRVRFLRRLTNAGCGAGIINARERIERTNISLIVFIFITILVSSTFQLLHAFKVDTPLANDPIDKLGLLPIILLVICTLFCLTALMNSLSVISIHFLIICAEYEKLADEFREDLNTFQLPVVTHYSHAHHNLWRLWTVVKSIMSYYQTFNLLSNMILFIYLFSTVNFQTSWIDFGFGLYLALFSLASIILPFLFVSSFRHAFKRLQIECLELAASGKILHDGVYAFLPVLASSIQRKIYRLRLFGLVDVNIRNLIKLLFLCVVVASVLRLLFNRNELNKIV